MVVMFILGIQTTENSVIHPSPNTSSLYGEPSMLRIDNISDPGEFMTFDVEYNEVILAEATIQDGVGNAYGEGVILSIGIDNDFE